LGWLSSPHATTQHTAASTNSRRMIASLSRFSRRSSAAGIRRRWSIRMMSSPSWASKLSVLKRGHPVPFRGQFRRRFERQQAPGDCANNHRRSPSADCIDSGARCRPTWIHGITLRRSCTDAIRRCRPAELGRMSPSSRCSRRTCPCTGTAPHGSSTGPAGTFPGDRCNHREPDRVRQSRLVSHPFPIVFRATRIVHQPSRIVSASSRPRIRRTRLRSCRP
jgi:hypothetical protein